MTAVKDSSPIQYTANPVDHSKESRASTNTAKLTRSTEANGLVGVIFQLEKLVHRSGVPVKMQPDPFKPGWRIKAIIMNIR